MASDPKPDARQQRRGRVFIIAFVLFCAGVVATSLFTNLTRLGAKNATSTAATTAAGVKLEALTIVSGDKRHNFQVEVMRNDQDRGRGLMFRQSMPQDHGMLFDFERDQMVSMWMRNTFIPLDMIFIFADGRIHRIEANTEPQNETTISSGVPVRSVLEVNAGVAARLGLKSGDRVLHSMFR